MKYIFAFLVLLVAGYFFATIVALVYNKRLKRNGFTGIPWKECFFPEKHFSFLIGYFVSKIPKHIIEQYVLRFYDDECQKCYKSGECLHRITKKKTCGCDPYKKACSPFEKCSNSYWGLIIFNKSKAEAFLKSLKYKISITYGDQ